MHGYLETRPSCESAVALGPGFPPGPKGLLRRFLKSEPLAKPELSFET